MAVGEAPVADRDHDREHLDALLGGRQRWAMRWKPALNAFSITFADWFPAAETY